MSDKLNDLTQFTELIDWAQRELAASNARAQQAQRNYDMDLIRDMLARHGREQVTTWARALCPSGPDEHDSMSADESAYAARKGTGVRASWSGD